MVSSIHFGHPQQADSNPVYPIVCPAQSPPLQRLGGSKWPQRNLIHSTFPFSQMPCHHGLHPHPPVCTFTLGPYFKCTQGCDYLKKYCRRSFGKDWSYFLIYFYVILDFHLSWGSSSVRERLQAGSCHFTACCTESCMFVCGSAYLKCTFYIYKHVFKAICEPGLVCWR